MADATRRHGVLEAPGVAVAALPELPDELRYTLHGTALLLVDRRTNAVVDVLPHAFREGWGRPLALFEEE